MLSRIFPWIIVGMLAIAGCSGTGNSGNPVTPVNSTIQTGKTLPIMVESLNPDGTPQSGAGVLGIFQGVIDPVDLHGELTPLRSSTLDDTVEIVDITNFLRLAPCSNCVKLMSVELDSENRVVLKIRVKHPFPVGDPFKPITGRNRADLHVFNVEGTVFFDDAASSTIFPGMGQSLGPQYLVNADGYSSYLDTAIDEIYPTQATVHPYVLHFDDYSQGNFNPASPTGFDSVTDPPPSGNLVMAMGCDYNVKDYVFNAPAGESFNFIYAVGCTYAISAATKSQRFTPEFQIPQHNKKAASELAVEITSNFLSPADTNSSADFLIKVLDINHGVAVGDARDQMKADSSVSKIFIEVPGVTSDPVGGTATPTGGNGRDPLNPLTFNLTIHNDLGADEGTYNGLVKVLDSYAPGQNTAPLLNGMDAIKRVNPMTSPLTGLYALPEFATYMAFSIKVEKSNHAPIASFTTVPVGTPDLMLNYLNSVNFTSTSTDPDDPLTPEGQIVKYEWDWQWDGVPANFNDDTAGVGTNIETHVFTIPGTYRVGLRVTDNGAIPMSGIFSIGVIVDPWSDEIVVDSNNGRIPKIAQMPSGKMIVIWAGDDVKTYYSVYTNSWSARDVVVNSVTSYLSIWPGPGQDEAWAGGGIQWYQYSGSPGLWTPTTGYIGSCIQTHVYSDPFGGYGVLHNTNSAFGWIMRTHYSSITQVSPDFFQEYIVWYAYNNRLMGESRILERNSSGQMFLVYMQDLNIDPYYPHQDLRYVHCARFNPITTGYSHPAVPIDQGAQDYLDSIAIACDTSDKLHVVYRSQPNGGGNYSIIYKNSSDTNASWGNQSIIRNGPEAPEYEYMSIDTDSHNNIEVTYRINDTIYAVHSSDGITWSPPESVNDSWPGSPTADKEQYMVIDSSDQTHVVWNRCAAGPVGYGPIRHRFRAPLS